ncbi:MAG: divergent PAP2 family protein [Patescibacteria group bacterium]
MSYKILLTPFIALIIAQLIKVIVDSTRGKFSWKNFNSYGGFPSSHSALVSALATEVGLLSGFLSIPFVISITLAFVVIRDAVGLRQMLGKHAKILNMLIKDLPDYKEDKYPFLEERLGHTYWQALAGIILGIIVALLI